MKTKTRIIIFIFSLFIFSYSCQIVYAQQGCCSWHGGESGDCTSDGREICNDGEVSPSCRCASDSIENSRSGDESDSSSGFWVVIGIFIAGSFLGSIIPKKKK